MPVSVGRSATTCRTMLTSVSTPSHGPNTTLASAPTAAQNGRLWLQVPWNSGAAHPARIRSESALGRNCAAVTTAKVSGRGSIEAIASAMPTWPNCIVSPGKGPETRWAQRFKPVSSGVMLPVPFGLPRRDHLREQDATDDRRGKDVAARVGREPALPLEQIERRLDGGSLEPGRRGELPDVHPLPQRGGGTEQLLGRCRKLAEP